MTKQEFVDQVAAKSQLTRRDAQKAVDAFLDVVTETLKTVNVLTRGSRMAVQSVGGVVVLLQGIGAHTGPPDAWLGAARLDSPSGFSSEEQEVLARVAQLLSHMVSQAVLEDPMGWPGTHSEP